jgi:hypothetical protein
MKRGVKFDEVFIDQWYIESIEAYLRTLGDNVNRLVFSYARTATDFTGQVLIAAEYCRNLTCIEIESSPITPALATLLSANRSLTSLSCSEQLDEINLAALKRFCPGLQRFHARGEMKGKKDTNDLYYGGVASAAFTTTARHERYEK